jgi:hypothetical protein
MEKQEYIAVVTARKGSVRLPNKNLLPLNSMSLAVRSVIHALDSGFDVILSTDIPELAKMVSNLPCKVVVPPDELSDGNHHKQQIEHAIQGYEERNVILLQPTSPFRPNKLINRCVQQFEKNPSVTCITGYESHQINSDGIIEKKQSVVGNVIIYPPKKIFDYKDHTICKVYGIELIEIDTYEDYVRACIESMRFHEQYDPSVSEPYLSKCIEGLKSLGFDGEHNLVFRPEDKPRKNLPTMYVNSCAGYDGGRVDALILVANEDMVNNPNSSIISECIDKSKLIIIRNHRYTKQLINKYPKILGKEIVIETTVSHVIDTLTTGAIAQDILNRCGGITNRFGYYKNGGQDRLTAFPLNNVHYAGISYDTAIFNTPQI